MWQVPFTVGTSRGPAIMLPRTYSGAPRGTHACCPAPERQRSALPGAHGSMWQAALRTCVSSAVADGLDQGALCNACPHALIGRRVTAGAPEGRGAGVWMLPGAQPPRPDKRQWRAGWPRVSCARHACPGFTARLRTVAPGRRLHSVPWPRSQAGTSGRLLHTDAVCCGAPFQLHSPH